MHYCRWIQQVVATQTNCPVDSCNRLGGMVLFQGLVDTFNLTITFRVISQGECSFMSKALLRDLKKCEMNSEPQSEVMWEGTPCLEKTCRTNNLLRLAEVIALWVGMNMPCFYSYKLSQGLLCLPGSLGAARWNPWIWSSRAAQGSGAAWESRRACDIEIWSAYM